MFSARFARAMLPQINFQTYLQYNKIILQTTNASVCSCKRMNSNVQQKKKKKLKGTPLEMEIRAEMFRRKAKKTLDNIPVLTFIRGMSVEDIALETNKTTDEVIEKLQTHMTTKVYPRTEIEDILIVRKALEDKINLRVIEKMKKKETVKKSLRDLYKRPPPTDATVLVSRPPVVTVMGHVDHGKTTLLDSLRQTAVAQSEAGGITQAIGAFTVKLPGSGGTTFIDTPGHAAFTAMRQRGVQVTDIVVLVVAADDGVMPQTKESIQLAESSGATIVVAVNKCDLNNVDIDLVLDELRDNGVVVDKLGGKVQSVNISALKGKGLDKLVEAINLQAGVMDIVADPTGLVEAVVLETRVEQGKGFVASAIVQRGTLKKGQVLVAGTSLAVVRAILDENNKVIESATPGIPVSILGFKESPESGQIILEAETRSHALEAIECRKQEDITIKEDEEYKIVKRKRDEHRKFYIDQHRRFGPMKKRKRYLENVQQSIAFNKKEHTVPQFNIIIKSDTAGSLIALLDAFEAYEDDRCEFNIVSTGVGNIGESDVKAAEACQGQIYLFNVAAGKKIVEQANNLGVEIFEHEIIYRILDDIRNRILQLLLPSTNYKVVGEAQVLKTFKYKRLPSAIAGCEVRSGCLLANEMCRVMRDNKQVFIDKLAALKHVKQNIDQANTGTECGLRFSNEFMFQSGDVVQSVILVQEHYIKWDLPGSQDGSQYQT